jgi:putative FmdB family regulatory protein
MPTYDYECDACGHKFELFQGIKDDIQKKCPECKKMKLRRLFGTGAAVIFKGSGFYQTDYRNENYKKGAAADKTAKEASQPKETSSSDSSSSKNSESKSTESKSSSSSETKPGKPKKDKS